MSIDEHKAIINESLMEVDNLKNPIPALVPADELLLNPTETVALLRISKVTLNKWMNTDKLPYLRMGRKIYFKKSEVMKSLTNRIGIIKRKF